jgi:hypothetical protein
MRGVALVPSSRLDILWLDENLAMNYTGWNNIDGAWPTDPNTPGVFDNLGGIFTSPPAGVALGTDRLEVFGLGTDYALYNKSYNAQADATGQHWTPRWENLGGDFTSTPVVVSPANDRVDIFGLGPDQGMVHGTRAGTSWSGWEELGGCFTSPPAVLPAGPDTFDLFARGADFLIYHARLTATGLSEWAVLGGGLLREPIAASAPAAVRVRGEVYVFVVAADQATWYTWFDGKVWRPWSSLGGASISEPVAIALVPVTDLAIGQHPYQVHVFAVHAGDHALWHGWLDGQGWHGWAIVPEGAFACAPGIVAPDRAPTVTTMPPAHFRVVEADLDGTIHLRRFDGTEWTGWDHGPQYRLPSTYMFTVDSFDVTDTMAADEDTDLATATLGIGTWPPQSSSFHIDSVDNGNHPLSTHLQFGPATVELCEPAMLSWSIANSNDSDTEGFVISVLIKAAEDVVNDALKTAVPILGPVGGAIFAAILDSGLAFALGGCNGIVAVGATPRYPYGRILQQAAPRRGGAAVVLQDVPVIPEPADLHPAPGDPAGVVDREELVEQLGRGDLHREPGLGE